LPVLYAGARAFFFPSVYEGFGLPILESLASGVPTLASNQNPIRDIIGNATWLTNPDDPEELSAGITEILANETWRSRAIEQGLTIAGRHDWKSCAVRTVDLYCRIAT
jgi:alpha-1,3-rhamnosyl/mannosyltransferase